MTNKNGNSEYFLHKPNLSKIKSPLCETGSLILERTFESSESLLLAFEVVRSEIRGRRRGMSSDSEQDLLRAMLIMTSSGLDSMMKQLIRDALPSLVKKNETVRDGLEKFVLRNIQGLSNIIESNHGLKFLSKVLASESPQSKIIEEYIHDLTQNSLQSVPELSRIISVLGLIDLKLDHTNLKKIFDVRNKIVHELDINLEKNRKKRHIRGLEDMKSYTNTLLMTAENIIISIDKLLLAA